MVRQKQFASLLTAVTLLLPQVFRSSTTVAVGGFLATSVGGTPVDSNGNIIAEGGFNRAVTMSLGVAQMIPGMENADALLKAADEAVEDE